MIKLRRTGISPLAATFFALLCPWCSFAKEPSPESIEKLLVVSQVQNQALAQIGKVSTAVDAIVNEAVNKQKLTPTQLIELQKKLPEFSKQLQKIILDELAWSNVKHSYATIYSQTFSQEEVSSLISFYQSPAGKAFLTKMPKILEQTSQCSLERLPSITQSVQKASTLFLKNLQSPPPKK
ncbi:MAG: hypothetical protein DVB28_000733 [Verrucomicrobia bacterium]|nr:MAG: hypothetical protein DVB28_000733 [Verrucomicrobiota bacterium]